MLERLLCGIMLVISLGPVTLSAGDRQAPETPMREIFVPFTDLDLLLEGDTRRVFLSRQEYRELQAKARQAPLEHAPIAVLPLSATYETQVQAGRASTRGQILLEVLEPGIHAVPLELRGVGIRRAALDGQPAALGRNEHGDVSLFVSGQGRKELILDLVMPLQTTAAQQSLAFTLPTPGSTRHRLTAPGNVEVRSGAEVIERVVDEGASITRFELLTRPGPVNLVLSLNNRLLLQQRLTTARSVMISEVTQAYERLHASFSLEVLHGASERFRFRLPAGFEVTDVTAAALSRWGVAGPDEEAVLEVQLREPATGTVTLNISAMANHVDLTNWRMPDLQPLDVANHVSVLGVLLEDRLSLETLTAGELLSIDQAVLMQALPASVLEAAPGMPRLRPAAAFLAPDGRQALSARFNKPPAGLQVQTAMLMTLGEKEQHLRGTLTLTPTVEMLFSVDVTEPAGWQVLRITDEQGAVVEWERQTETGAGQRLQIRLPAGVAPASTISLTLEARSIPSGWLDSWIETAAAFPVFGVIQATETLGAIALQARDDLQLRPEQLTGLTPLAPREQRSLGLPDGEGIMAFRINAADYAASFIVTRTLPRITARALSFLQIAPDGLSAHYELIFDIQDARARRLSFSLPQSTPSAISIAGLNGLQVKEYVSQEAAGRREWTAELAAPVIGEARLSVDFVQTLPSETPTDYALPLAEALNVEYQTFVVAVEGNPEFDVQVNTNGRKLDVGELADAQRPVGKRLLGAYGFLQDPQVLVDVARRPGYGLPAALTERAEMVTLVSVGGRSQTVARYLLRTKAAFLQLTLPTTEAKLWSVAVDGEPALPQRDGNDLVVSLAPKAGDTLRDLRIVFEAPISPLAVAGELDVTAPRLVVRTEDGNERYEVPSADLQWQLVLPEGYRIMRTGGTVSTDQLPRGTSPIAVVGKVLYVLSGGIRPFYMFRPAREAAARISSEGQVRDYMAKTLDEAAPSTAPSPPLDQAEFLGFAANQVTPPEPASPEGPGGAVVPSPLPTTAAAPAEPGSESPLATQVATDTKARERLTWALEGVRSLPLSLEPSGETVQFVSMGVAPRLQATLMHGLRLQFLAWGLAALVGLWGCLQVDENVGRKAYFVIAMLTTALAAPLLLGLVLDVELAEVFAPMFYVAVGLVPFYLLAGMAKQIAAACEWLSRRSNRVAATVVLALAVSGIAPAQAQEPTADAALIDWDELLARIPPGKPVQLPKDAVIIPYDDASADGLQSADKVLVPYEEYARLWHLAFPDQPVEVVPAPSPFAWAGASYAATLSGEEYLLVSGELLLDVFRPGSQQIPLPLEGAVLESITVDGRAARLRMMSSQEQPAARAPSQQASAQPSTKPPAGGESLAVLEVTEPGRKVLRLTVRFRLDRSGGWRVVRGRLPAAPATALRLSIPHAETEVRLADLPDRSLYETVRDQEVIETTLAADGLFRLQWRPRVAASQVDQSLTAQSAALLDIREDGVRLAWQVVLQSSHGQRDAYTFLVPGGYLVDAVKGDNLRSWQTQPDGDAQRVDVTLLQPSTGAETVTLLLSRPEAVGGESATALRAPAVIVPDAVLHQGHLAIRRGPLLDLRAEENRGLTRVDASSEFLAPVLAAVKEESPLGLRPFQNYRFAGDGFRLDLSIRRYTAQIAAEERTLLRIAPSQTTLETRFQIEIQDRAIHHLQVALPADLTLKEVLPPMVCDWSVTEQEGRRLLTVYLPAGVIGPFQLDLRGTLSARAGDTVAAPQFQVLDARQTGFVTVQVDPSVNVSVEQLTNAEEIPLSRVASWVTDQQRQLARLAIAYRAANYNAQFRVTPRTPRVNGLSITNVRVTPQQIEETIFLQYRIQDAGIRTLAFLLPASLADARVTVPLLREKFVEPVGGDPDTVRVRLELQDEVIDQLMVLVRQNRSLSVGVYEIPVPTLETGTTDDRFAVLESAGRDEVVVAANVGFTELNRQLAPWKKLADMLGSQITQAYVAQPNLAAPRLAIQTRERGTVETAGARIGLARTQLVVDSHGAYRGVQEYRVDNQTEQFLEIELPANAQLWTVQVAGEAVKPSLAPNSTTSRRVRVPLIKTQTGDLDYAVLLKYGGHLDRFPTARAIPFPLMRTLNINVEQSQVRLWLPQTHHWLNFDGTMSRVRDADELTADVLSYQTRQLHGLIDVLRSDASDEFSKLRAGANVKSQLLLLNAERQGYEEVYRNSRNRRLQNELVGNSAVIRQAEQELQEQSEGLLSQPLSDNSSRLRALYESQSANRAKDVVNELGNNFDFSQTVPSDAPHTRADRFNEDWLQKNYLNREESAAKKQSRLTRDADRPAPGRDAAEDLDSRFKELRDVSPTLDAEGKQLGQSRRGELRQQLEMYQQRLESQNKPDQLQSAGEYFRAPQAERVPGMGAAPLQSGVGGGGFGRGVGGPAAARDMSIAGRDSVAARPEGVLAWDVPTQAAASGLASLDVAIPERGREYLFTTPRGEIVITARAVPASTVSRASSLLALATVLILLLLIFRVLCWIAAQAPRRGIAAILIILGLASLILWVLPVFGGLVLGAGLWMLWRRPPTALASAIT